MAFEFKFNQKSIDDMEQNVREAFRKVNNKQMLDEIGSTVVTDVRDVTRNQDKSIPLELSELKLLKESWIISRTRLAKTNTTDRAFEDGRSNLTFTGQLLNSMKHIVVGPGRLMIKFMDIHKGYKSATGKVSKEISNELLAKYVAEQGRPFFGVRPSMRRQVNRIVKQYVKRALLVARLTKNSVDN
jgi:hypothetical protein